MEADDGDDLVVKAAALMHGVEYQVMVRAPDVFETIQVYREQYQLARGLIIPLAILALILPFWAPVVALDGVGSIGPFPIIRSQVFLVSLLASSVRFVAFWERAYRYSAAKALACVTNRSDRSGRPGRRLTGEEAAHRAPRRTFLRLA